MCEALLRVVDQVNDDAAVDVKLTKAGHVICIFGDGWNWSTEERTAPFWRIIALPGVTVDFLSDFLMGESAARMRDNALDPLANPQTNRMLAIRAFMVDLTALPATARNALAKARTGTGVLTVSKTAITNAKKRIAARADPNVLG